jgi:hypothetical protein
MGESLIFRFIMLRCNWQGGKKSGDLNPSADQNFSITFLFCI